MTDRIVKLVANQGGPFTQTSNLVDFDIPADGTYDFSKSFVNLYARIDTTDTIAGGGSTGKAVYAINLMGAAATTDSTFNDNIHNICFVKNASLSPLQHWVPSCYIRTLRIFLTGACLRIIRIFSDF